MLDYQISKKTLEYGWAEFHIVMRFPGATPDFDLMGQAAKTKLTKTIVAMTAGMAGMLGDTKFERLCVRFGEKYGLILNEPTR